MNENRHMFSLLPPASEALDEALEAVSALGRMGLVVAHHWPTAEMIEAGASAGGVPAERAIAIYRAMIEASSVS